MPELWPLGDVPTMNDKRTFPVVPIVVLVALFIFVAMGLFVPLQEKIDDLHLAKFVQKIAATDRIVATKQTYSSHKMMSLSLSGEDARRVVQAISSARANRSLVMVQSPPEVMFFHGTNVLAEIIAGSTLFSADGRHYKDSSGVLDRLVYTPLSKMIYKEEMKGVESQ